MKKTCAARFAAMVCMLALIVVAVPTSPAQAERDERNAHDGDRVPGQYIVVFKDSVGDTSVATHDMERVHGLGIQHEYSRALRGFTATVPAAELQQLQNDPRSPLSRKTAS